MSITATMAKTPKENSQGLHDLVPAVVVGGAYQIGTCRLNLVCFELAVDHPLLHVRHGPGPAARALLMSPDAFSNGIICSMYFMEICSLSAQYVNVVGQLATLGKKSECLKKSLTCIRNEAMLILEPGLGSRHGFQMFMNK